MAKANLVLPDGTKVAIEGTAQEVSSLLSRLSRSEGHTPLRKAGTIKQKSSTSVTKEKKKDGPTGLVTGLINENFFKSRRTLPDIQKKLEEKGHIYAQTSLSPILVRLVRRRELRRIKEKKGWIYVA